MARIFGPQPLKHWRLQLNTVSDVSGNITAIFFSEKVTFAGNPYRVPYGTEEQNGLSRMKHLSKSEPDIAPMGEVRSFFTFFPPFILNICFSLSILSTICHDLELLFYSRGLFSRKLACRAENNVMMRNSDKMT